MNESLALLTLVYACLLGTWLHDEDFRVSSETQWPGFMARAPFSQDHER